MEYLILDANGDRFLGQVKKTPAVVLLGETSDDLYFIPKKKIDSYTVERILDGGLRPAFFITQIECSSACTLNIYFTKESYMLGTPGMVCNLNAGKNTIKVNHSIFRLDIASYNINSTDLKLKSVMPEITGIEMEGILDDTLRLLDLTNITYANLQNLNTCNATDFRAMFQSCKSLKKIKLTNLDPSHVESFDYMINKCPILTDIGDVSRWDISNGKTFTQMFANTPMLKAISGIDKWNFASAVNLTALFSSCTALKDIGDLSGWSFPNATIMQGMFNNCQSLEDIGKLDNWDVKNNTSFYRTFGYCGKLKTIGDLSKWSVSNVSSTESMFLGCSALTSVGNLDNWDTSSLVNASGMFCCCYNLTGIGDIQDWNAFNVTDTTEMFFNCTGITNIQKLIPTTLKVIGDRMFYNIKWHDSKELDLSNVETIGCDAFKNNYNIEKIKLGSNLKTLGHSDLTSSGNTAIFPVLLESIELSEENQNFVCENNVILYSKDGSICYGGADYGLSKSYEEYLIREGVTQIAGGAFTFVGCKTNTEEQTAYNEGLMDREITDDSYMIKRIVLPSTLQVIGAASFRYIKTLESVKVLAETPPTIIGTSVFRNFPSNFKIYVPSASLDAYKTAWSYLSSFIYGF